MVSIVLAPQYILKYELINIFNIKCYFRANLKIDVTKNRIFRGISWVKLKSEIHSPGNFLLLQHIVDLLGDVFYIFFRFRNVLNHVMCQINYNDLPIIRKECQLAQLVCTP